MRIITLISDWGNSDYYVAALKTTLLSQCENINIVDISHSTKTLENIEIQASYLLKNIALTCPKDTIHLICIDNVRKNARFFIVKHQEQYYFSSDNSILKRLFHDSDAEIYEIKPELIKKSTFPEKNIFAPFVVKLLNNEGISHFTNKSEITNSFQTPRYIVRRQQSSENQKEEKLLTVTVTHIDSTQNVHLNISKEEFFEEKKGFEHFRIELRRKKIQKISEHYEEVEENGDLAIFGDDNLLQLVMRQGTMAQLYAIGIASQIKIVFFN